MIFQFFRSIRVLFSVFLGIILLFVYLGFHFYQADKNREFGSKSRELESIARLKHSAILQWYAERYADARYIFSNKNLRISLNSSQTQICDSSEVFPLISSIYRNHDYSNMFLLDPSTGKKMMLNPSGSDDVMKDSLEASLQQNRIKNSEFYVDKLLEKPCLDLYIPFKLSNKRNLVIVLKVDPYKVLFPLVFNWYINASSGESLVVTAFGDSIKYISPLKYHRNITDPLKKSMTDLDIPAVKAIKGVMGVITGIDYRGTEVLADVRRIENTPWYLITKMDLAEVFEPVNTSTLNNMLIMGLLISLGGILLLYYYTRSNYNNLRKITETEKKFKNIFNNATEAIVILNKDRIIDCNSGAEKMYGLPKKKILGRTPGSFSPEYQPGNRNSSELAIELINKTLAGHPQRFEWIHTKGDGLIYTDITLTAIEVEGEKLVAGFLHDITERKLIEDALYESEKMYRSIFDSAPVGIYQSTIEGKFIKANKALAKILGYDSADDLCKVDLTDIYEDKTNRRRFIDEYEPTGSVSDMEVKWKKKDGSVIWVQLNAFAVKDPAGSTNHFEGYVRDITNRKLAEEHIQTLTKAIEQSPVCVIITDINGSIRYINKKFTEVTGYQLNEVINKNPRILKSGTQNEEFYKNLWKTINSGNTWSGEMHNKKKNGELYWEYAIISPIVDSGGKILNFVAVKEDITEKKMMIEDLVMAKDKAEEANRLKSSFLANMSHELRTPMVGILGYADILVSELSDPEQIELAKMVLSSGKRLIDTLNSILDLSSIEAKKMDLKHESVDVIDILKESVSIFIPNAASKGLYLKSVLPAEKLFINSDGEILQKIFLNLINNAVKYTQSGGITVELKITKEDSENKLVIHIADTGIGISADYHEIIFEPFRQVSEGYTRKFEGSGLGLSITNKLVKMLHGSIYLESTPGKGSCFTVNLPLVLTDGPHNETNATPMDELFELRENLSILLVEDDALNADIILSYLKPFCSIDHVPDGEAAANFCKKRKYDTILMDINLKGINGIEAMENIRNLDAYYKQLPIIAVTALAMTGDREKLLAVGFDNYLSKPFERGQLLKVISDSLKSVKIRASRKSTYRSSAEDSA